MSITGKQVVLKVNAALFDVDGTIIISQPAIAEFWKDFGKDKPYFDSEHIIMISHGMRTYDVIKEYAPDFADEEYTNSLESEIPDKFGRHAIEVPGASRICGELNKLPKEKWAVATSGTFDMATKWFKILNIKKPSYFVTANDVKNGKPHPEPYVICRTGLGYPPSNRNVKVIVFEDAPAGIKAGKAAGCKIVGVATTFDKDALIEKGCDLIIKNFESVELGEYDPIKDEIEFIFKDFLYAKDDLINW